MRKVSWRRACWGIVLLMMAPIGEMRGPKTSAPDEVAAQSRSVTSSKKRAVRRSATRARVSRTTAARSRRVARRRAAPRLVVRPGRLIPRERVLEIQRALIERGFLEGPPTGVYDERTIAAMRRFQEAEGIEVTGYPTAHALYRLGLHPAASSRASSSRPSS